MAEILPGFVKFSSEALKNDTEAKILAVEHYILIGLYVFLLALAFVNVYHILIK